MKKHKVISNLPVKLPISNTILYCFLLYYFNVDNLWWGIFITVFSVYWIFVAFAVFSWQEEVNIFEDKIANENGKMITFAERRKKKEEKRYVPRNCSSYGNAMGRKH